MKNYNEFLNVMNFSAIPYEKELSKKFLEAYWKLLKEYSFDEFREAMNTICRTSKFWPRPSEIIEVIEKNRTPAISIEARAEQQWRIVLSTLGRGPFDDPVTIHLCSRQFNYGYLRNMLEKDENWEQKRFCKSYELAAETWETYPQIEDMPEKVKKLVGSMSIGYDDPKEKRIAELRKQGQEIEGMVQDE